ncbi:MAG: carbon-nitrogen hydrolase [Planctomycetaceae bacterium]|jgi:N-carbamoylputrescine amidase|nr:carbon-nitrogen hydrolase [Planctomycetaceae bacterium]
MSSSRRIKIGLIQMKCTSDTERNFNRAMELTREAARNGAKIVCLPELFRSLYFCQTEDHRHFSLAEPIPGPSTEILASLAQELGIVLIASLFEKRAEGLYHNTVAMLDNHGEYLGKYRKMHIPDDPLFYEKFYFTPGDLGFKSFETEFGKLGTLICWDQWYPEAARLTALRGAEVLFYPTAIGWHPSEKAEFGQSQHESWELIQRSHAVANGCYVVSVNRIGHEGEADAGIEFWGQSFVADPTGQVLVRGSIDREEVLIAEINRDQSDVSRTHWPFLRDRRIDAYSDITKRFIDE